MTAYTIDVKWTCELPTFDYKTFNRSHTLYFSGGETLKVSAPPDFLGDAKLPNPEELLISALSSCFMLTFLAFAAGKKLEITSYNDKPEGVLTKTAEGKMLMTDVTLRPVIAFKDNKKPDEKTLQELCEKAHQYCFVANSVKTTVHIQPIMS